MSTNTQLSQCVSVRVADNKSQQMIIGQDYTHGMIITAQGNLDFFMKHKWLISFLAELLETLFFRFILACMIACKSGRRFDGSSVCEIIFIEFLKVND